MIRKSFMFLNFESYGVPDGDLLMDFSFWIMRTNDQLVLVDTGYDIPRRTKRGDISILPPPEGLELLGIDPLDVDVLLISHFHYDHIGYVGLFKNAQIVAGKAEYDYWFKRKAANDLEGQFTFEEDLIAIEVAEKEGRLRLVDETTEVLPGVTLYQVGGHCPGELVILVETDNGAFILASDAAHFYDQVENQWAFRAYFDYEDMMGALRFIAELAESKNAIVIPGHDGRTRERFAPVPGDAGRIATIIL